MEALATYLIKSSVWLTGFALVYALFLRNERFFTLNRIYLVSGILVSIIFPLFTWHYTVLLPVVPSVEVSDPQVQGIVMPEEPLFTMQNALLILYLSGIIYLIYRIIRQTIPVFTLIRKSETYQYSSAKLIRTTEYPASFSFFSFVFVNPSIDEIETNEIVNHELEHIRQQHWIDLLLFEILRTVQWFNPAIWLYGHLIRQNHEYLADERALQRSSNPAIYRAALLNQMFGGPVISLANSFNYSLNKKRFNMMKQKIESPFRKLKLLLVLPLIAGVFYAFATPEYQFIGGAENQSPQKSLYSITTDKIDIPFTTQLQKSDLDAIRSDLEKIGMKIDYKTLDFTKAGNLKQISATVKQPDGGSVSFTSSELTTTNYPTFRTYPDGSFGVYFQKAVTGKVTAGDGKPLKGASIVISGTTTGTVTDANGNFKLTMTDDSPIVVSYVGFGSQKVIPNIEKEMEIVLKTNTNQINLDEKASTSVNKINPNVVYIVDGKEITKTEMEKIKPDKIESINLITKKSGTSRYIEEGEKGVILVTMKNDGQTPQTLKTQTNSPLLFGNTDGSGIQPLYLKDGVIIESEDMQKIDPETIESVNVLKGESATKKYGDKGKNGVVEITLKKSIVGNSSKIGNISWVNNTVYNSAKLNEVLGMKEGEDYNKEKVKERIFGEVAGLYLDNGYLFNNIEITEIPKDESTTDLKFTIFEGNSYKIGKIEIEGNKTIATKDILNKISIKSGDLFSRTKLTQSVRALATIDKLDPEKINPDVNPQLENVYSKLRIVDLVFNVTEK